MTQPNRWQDQMTVLQLEQLTEPALRELVLQALGVLAVKEERSLREVTEELHAEVEIFSDSIDNSANGN